MASIYTAYPIGSFEGDFSGRARNLGIESRKGVMSYCRKRRAEVDMLFHKGLELGFRSEGHLYVALDVKDNPLRKLVKEYR